MKIIFLISALVACAIAEEHCIFGAAGGKPQSLVTCKNATVEELGKNLKIKGKAGPFEEVTDFHLTAFVGKLDADSLSLMTKLERLTIEDSQIPKISAVVFEKCCKNLKILTIRNNAKTVIDPASFKSLEKLEELSIHQNIGGKLTKEFLKGTPLLKKLTLRKTKLAEIDENAFEDLKNLETLELYDNTFPTLKPNTFKNLKNLKALGILDNTAMKEFNLDMLVENKKLELLGLPAELISKIDLAKLKKQFPKLQKLEMKLNEKKKFEDMLKKVAAQDINVTFVGNYW